MIVQLFTYKIGNLYHELNWIEIQYIMAFYQVLCFILQT